MIAASLCNRAETDVPAQLEILFLRGIFGKLRGRIPGATCVAEFTYNEESRAALGIVVIYDGRAEINVVPAMSLKLSLIRGHSKQ